MSVYAVPHVNYAILDKSAPASLRLPRRGDTRRCHMSKYSLDSAVLARFWAKVDKNGPIHPKLKTPCWLWTGSLTQGYGSVSLNGRSYSAHRLAYETLVGPMEVGLVTDHLCRNRCCCNPSHLEPVTNVENVMRGVGITALNAAKTHCKYGHPLEESNVYRDKRGRRECRICKRRLARAQKEKMRRVRAGERGEL